MKAMKRSKPYANQRAAEAAAARARSAGKDSWATYDTGTRKHYVVTRPNAAPKKKTAPKKKAAPKKAAPKRSTAAKKKTAPKKSTRAKATKPNPPKSAAGKLTSARLARLAKESGAKSVQVQRHAKTGRPVGLKFV